MALMTVETALGAEPHPEAPLWSFAGLYKYFTGYKSPPYVPPITPGVPSEGDVVMHLGKGYRVSQDWGWSFAVDDSPCGKIIVVGPSVVLEDKPGTSITSVDREIFSNLYGSITSITGVWNLPKELFGVFPEITDTLIFSHPDVRPVTGGIPIILRNANASVVYVGSLETSQLYLRCIRAVNWEILGDADGSRKEAIRSRIQDYYDSHPEKLREKLRLEAEHKDASEEFQRVHSKYWDLNEKLSNQAWAILQEKKIEPTDWIFRLAQPYFTPAQNAMHEEYLRLQTQLETISKTLEGLERLLRNNELYPDIPR